MTILGVTLNLYALAAFLAVSWTAAFALGRFCRNGGSTGTAWERATRGDGEDFGRHSIGRDPIGMSADEIRALIAADYPSARVDGKRGE